MNILALPSALAFTMNLILCLVVLSSNPRNIAHRLFAGFVLSFATWNMGELIMINSVNPVHAIIGVKIIFAGLTFAPLFFLHFTFAFPVIRKTKWIEKKRIFFLYLIPIIILTIFYLTFRMDIEKLKGLRNVFYYGLLLREPLNFLIFLGMITIFSGICIYWGIRNLLDTLRITRIPRQKLQIKYLIFGIISMAIVGTIINLSNYFLKLGWPIFFLASFYSILVSLFFAIALIKYRLLDIHLLIRGGIIYSTVSGLIITIYILVIKNIGEAISRRAYGKSILVESAMILALVYLFLPIQRKVGDWLDRFFYMERVHFRNKLSELGRILTELVDPEEVAKISVNFIVQTFHVQMVSFFLLINEEQQYRSVFNTGKGQEIKYPIDHGFIKRLEDIRRSIDLEHMREYYKEEGEIEELIEKGWVLVTPFFLKEKLMGFVLLSRKLNNKDYTHEELEILDAFMNQTALALSRAFIFKEMSIKDRQIMQAEKLAAIGELAAGIAHEIRNPLSIITGSAETVKKHDDPKIREEMVNYILEESKRINGLISNFLEFARPQEPKTVLCDLREVLEKTLLLLSPKAKGLSIEIRKEFPKEAVMALIDPDQMRQAFINLSVNAIEAMPNGGVLSIKLFENPKGKIIIKFSDTGKGIPRELRTKVFNPFFTTKETGTGLGLSIAHQIINRHGGNIIVEDREEKGSTFIISLPI